MKLAELDEKLGGVEQARAETLRYVELETHSLPALEKLADFITVALASPMKPPRANG